MALAECQKDLLVIYENSAEDWAVYMKELLEPSLNINGISLYNLDSETDEMLESLYLCGYQCKLLLLTNVLLENLKERQNTHFCQLLQPSSNLVILLCGLETLDGFYELVPIDRDLQVLFTDQDPQDYVSAVLCIVHEDYQDYRDPDINCLQNSTIKDEDFESRETTEKTNSKVPSALVLPQKIPCENPGEIVIVLTEEIPTTSNVEIEFCTENQLIRRQATRWNGKVLSLKALEFPAGSVTVNVCCDDIIKASTEIKYYTLTGELEVLLRKVVDPIAFICQAFNVYSIEDLDMVLMKSLQNKMSSREFNLHEINQCTNANFEEIPTLLHCAAKFGLKEVTLLLMECPGADDILNITNKYGEDPATIADRHGHGEIKEIICTLAQKLNANKSDPQEVCDFEQDDVYVGMDVHSAQNSGDESVDNTIQESHENQNNVPDESPHSQPMLDYKEDDNYDEDLNVKDDYCFSFPVACDSGAVGNEYSILQDQQDCQGDDEQLYLDDNDYVEKAKENKEELKSIEYAVENIYTSMQQNSVHEEDIMFNESFAVTISSSESTLQTFQEPTNEENILNLNKEKSDNLFGNDHLPYSEWEYKCGMNESENKDGEEPYIVTSTDDSLYVTFLVPEKQREQQRTFSPYSPLPPEPEEEEDEEEDGNDHDNVSHNAQGEDEESNEHVSWREQEFEHKEEGIRDEEEQYIAATDDSLYIIFEAANKETQREQQSFKWADPIPDELPLHLADDNPAFIDKEKEDGNNKEYALNEHVCEGGNASGDGEEPCITATTDDNLYIVFEPIKKEPQRGQQCFSQNTNQPHPSLPSAEEYGSSHFAQASQTKESTNQNIWLDEHIDEMEYIYYEEDPYSLVYSDDDSLYIELPMESTEEPKREKKSFIIHRAPAPAPRVDFPAPENEPSYISQVFKQKQEEKKIYGTGMPQGLQLKDEDKNVYSFAPRFQQREQEKKMYATVSPKNKDKQQANCEGHVISQQCVPSGQEELILLQEKVKLGVMSMDEALEKFQQWQNEKSGLDRLQKEKLRQLRDSIIGDKIEDDRLYDKITIVHQPNVSEAHMKRGQGALDNIIYQTPFIPSTPYTAVKKDIYAPSKHHTK